MMAVTIFVLFGNDIRILYFPPSADAGFSFFVSLSFILFVLEVLLHSWAKSDYSKGIFKVKGYAFSFFFWLDLLAVLSMIPDVPWLASGIGLQSDFMDSLGEWSRGRYYTICPLHTYSSHFLFFFSSIK